MGLVQEFKEFALKGNMVDMAVGIIIGAAFGKIVTSLVSDLLMPPLGLATGGINFTDMKWVLKPAAMGPSGKLIEAVTLNYGNFVQASFDFLIMAFCIFALVKLMNRLRTNKPEPNAAPPEPPRQEILLTEIRDLLKAK
jgi:large conductance mechanosensitive channel